MTIELSPGAQWCVQCHERPAGSDSRHDGEPLCETCAQDLRPAPSPSDQIGMRIEARQAAAQREAARRAAMKSKSKPANNDPF